MVRKGRGRFDTINEDNFLSAYYGRASMVMKKSLIRNWQGGLGVFTRPFGPGMAVGYGSPVHSNFCRRQNTRLTYDEWFM